MHYHFKYYKEKDGFWAESIELAGCRTEGNNLDELRDNIQDALDLYISEPAISTHLFPKAKSKILEKNILQVSVSPKVAFAYNLRKQRLLSKMTQKQVSDKLGLKNIYSYQRLESPKTSNPALSTIFEIKKVFPKLKVDDIIEICG